MADATLQQCASSSDAADIIASLVQYDDRGRDGRCQLTRSEITIDVTNADDVPLRGGRYLVKHCVCCQCGAGDGLVSHLPYRFTLAGIVTTAQGRKLATYAIEDARQDEAAEVDCLDLDDSGAVAEQLTADAEPRSACAVGV